MAGNLIARTRKLFFSGVLAKVSFNGELLRKRYYQHIPEEPTSPLYLATVL